MTRRINLSDVEVKTTSTAGSSLDTPKWWENTEMLFSTTMEYYQWQNRLKGYNVNNQASMVQAIHEACQQPGLWAGTKAKVKSCLLRSISHHKNDNHGDKRRSILESEIAGLDKHVMEDITQWCLAMIRGSPGLRLHLVSFSSPTRSVPPKWRMSVWSTHLKHPKIYQESWGFFCQRMNGIVPYSEDMLILIQQKAVSVLTMDPMTLSSVQNTLSLALILYVASFVYKNRTIPMDVADHKIFVFLLPFIRGLVDEAWNPGPFKDPKCAEDFSRTAAQVTEMYSCLLSKMPAEFRSGSGPFDAVKTELLHVLEATDANLFKLISDSSLGGSSDFVFELCLPLINNLFIGYLPLSLVMVCWDQLIFGSWIFYEDQLLPNQEIEESSYLFHVRSFEEKVAHLCAAVILVLRGQVTRMKQLFDPIFKEECNKISMFQFKDALGKLKLTKFAVDSRTGRHHKVANKAGEVLLRKLRIIAINLGRWSLFLQQKFPKYANLVANHRKLLEENRTVGKVEKGILKRDHLEATTSPPFSEIIMAIQGKVSLLYNKPSLQAREEAIEFAMKPAPDVDTSRDSLEAEF